MRLAERKKKKIRQHAPGRAGAPSRLCQDLAITPGALIALLRNGEIMLLTWERRTPGPSQGGREREREPRPAGPPTPHPSPHPHHPARLEH